MGADMQQLTLKSALECIRFNDANFDIDSNEPILPTMLERMVVTNKHFMHALSM